ncbi:MAG: PAS domain S-box protein [Vampirovibrionia bacterium]
MLCSYCKTENIEIANFCYNCGNPFCEMECSSFLCDRLKCDREDVKSHLQTIIDCTLDSIIVTNNQGIISYWNNAASKLFGYDANEVLGVNLADCVITEDNKESYYRMFEDNFAQKASMVGKTVEKEMIKKDGNIFVAEISFSTMKIKGSDYIIGIVRDVSERKFLEAKVKDEKYKLESSILKRTEELNTILRSFERANDLLCEQNEELQRKNYEIEESKTKFKDTYLQLEKSEKYYRNLFTHMNEGVVVNEVIYDDEGEIVDFVITDVNPAFEAITGISKEKAIGQLGSVLYGERKPSYLEIARHVVKTRETIYTEIYRPYIDKYIRSGFFSPEKDKFALVFNDITEQIKTVDALNLTQFSVDNSAVGVAWISDDARFIYANKELIKMTGYSKEELLNMNVYDFNNNYPHTFWEKNLSKIKEKKLSSFEIIQLRKDGSTFPASVIANYFEYNMKGYHYFSIFDISERKRSERVKENFIATLSHDLRVPLIAENKALKYLSKGSYGELTEKQSVAVDNMIHSNNDLLNLVNTLLDVYKYDAEDVKVNWEDVDLSSIVKSCFIDLQPLIKDTNKKMHSTVPKEFVRIKADRKLVMRVLINLLSNAISYSNDDCYIEVSAKPEGEHVIISVSDNGIGIVEEEIDKIFDRYYTCSKKFRKVGTGLGLYLSRQIINAHGGDIWVTSELDKGSTFYFTLPRL